MCWNFNLRVGSSCRGLCRYHVVSLDETLISTFVSLHPGLHLDAGDHLGQPKKNYAGDQTLEWNSILPRGE